MATLNAVILPAKALKDGRHKVRISIAHNSETRYILTDIIIDSVKEFKNGQIVKRPDANYLNTKLRSLINKTQKTIDEIDCSNCLSCSELIHSITSKKEVLTLQALIDEFNDSYHGSEGSKLITQWSFKHLLNYVPGNTLIARIRNMDIVKIKNDLIDKKFSNNSINLLLSKISQLFNFAKTNGYIKDNNVFWRIPKLHGYTRQSWIDVESIKLIRDTTFKTKNLNQIRDIFMLSFYLGGINLADIVKLEIPKSRRLSYCRTKTARTFQMVSFDIPDEAMEILKRLPEYKCLKHKYYRLTCLKQMQKMRRELNLSDDFVFYSARKSFAQIAFDLGISTAVIDYILGHKAREGSNCLYSYISVTPQMATDAIRKVLDFIK